MGKKLCLSIYGELYMIDLEMVMYLQADDHYTIAYYASGTHFMIPFGLSKVEAAIIEKLDSDLKKKLCFCVSVNALATKHRSIFFYPQPKK